MKNKSLTHMGPLNSGESYFSIQSHFLKLESKSEPCPIFHRIGFQNNAETVKARIVMVLTAI